ncbi:hypothetical protein [Saliphagus sp. LR7]|uniref:DUF7118 family protein n=1 Tax=Saliphagus sp. LR7 TaxID=2282654 RepID=UPI000DF77422|nr:hypothetical protein [Saliphagus sp. LR7]
MSERLESPRTGEDDGPVERLEATRRRHAEAEDRIDEHGEDTVERVADAYRQATGLLEEYEGRAAGTGKETFKAYVELEGEFESLLEDLPEDLPRRGAFEDANDAIDKRRLSEADFERAREAVEPASEFVDLLEEREAAAEARESARIDLRERLDELEAGIERREELLELGSADLEAPVERLRDPIDRYNAAVEDAFEQYRREAPARELFDLVDRSRLYPLVPFERPPEALRRYVEEAPAGTEPVPTLLEYAGYSRSKLAHYVADADALKRRVTTERTFLEGIDAEPLTVEWPPEPAGVLSRRARELRPFVERVGSEAEVAALRAVRETTRDPEYGRLRRAAVAADRLTETERERLADGRVEAELERLRAERDRLREAL